MKIIKKLIFYREKVKIGTNPYTLLLFVVACLVLFPHYARSEDSDIKICLTLIVKNDEDVLERCLESVKDVVDCISICDLGSTDNTVLIAELFMKKHGIPVKIYPHEWRNFKLNRTFEAQAAQKTIKELGYVPNQTYLLTLDPHMVLKRGSGFKKSMLQQDAYMVLVKAAALTGYNYTIRLLRSTLQWDNIGFTNEYWVWKRLEHCEKIRTLMIEDFEEEGSKLIKFNRDIKQLTQAAKDEPSNAHYLFYLGHTYRAIKEYDKAIISYKAFVEKANVHADDIWFSKYMIGQCYEDISQWDQALWWYLDAYQYKPDRPESLQKIATYYRLRGQNNTAYIFAKHGSKIPYPKDQILFNTAPLNDFQFDEELSVVSYYTPFKDDGYGASSDLILRKSTPWYIKEQTCQNMLFYVHNLKDAQYLPIEIELPIIQEGLDERYHPMNPSIQKTPSGYKVICRSVNYTQKGAKSFNTVDQTGVFRTRNFLVEYTKDFKILSQREIIEKLHREKVHAFNIDGMEDSRIFELNNSSWFTCTTADTNPAGNLQISLCKLADKPLGSSLIKVEKLVPLKGPDPYRCEKNWLPFIKDGAMHVIYSYDPFIIYKPNIETGDCEKVLEYRPECDFSRFRGSAAPIPFDNGYLMVVHEVLMLPSYERCYFHRFLYLNKDMVITKVSKPFVFNHLGIEYCCSMVIDHSESRLVMPIGIEDREAYLCFIDLTTVRSLLNPLPASAETNFTP